MHSLDPVQEESELEAQVDQAKEANPEPEPEQGKHRCITPNPWLLFWVNDFVLRMIVH
jgi:hypothetical protein